MLEVPLSCKHGRPWGGRNRVRRIRGFRSRARYPLVTNCHFAFSNSNPFLHFLGVYFTKYCRDMSLSLGIGGWVKNSKSGTIVGKMQGPRPAVEQMYEFDFFYLI